MCQPWLRSVGLHDVIGLQQAINGLWSLSSNGKFRQLCTVRGLEGELRWFIGQCPVSVFWKRLTQVWGMWLVEIVISTNHMHKIWVSCLAGHGPVLASKWASVRLMAASCSRLRGHWSGFHRRSANYQRRRSGAGPSCLDRWPVWPDSLTNRRLWIHQQHNDLRLILHLFIHVWANTHASILFATNFHIIILV